MTCGTNWTTEILTILQFLELACNFFEPDRDLPRPTFDTSARPARPDGHVARDRDTAGQRQTRRRTTRQSVEVQISDSNGNICYFGMITCYLYLGTVATATPIGYLFYCVQTSMKRVLRHQFR